MTDFLFATRDTPLKSGSLNMTEADRNVLESATTGRDTRPITPEEMEEIAKKAETILNSFREIFKDMPMEVARFIRSLRVDANGTWRYVAETCNNEYGGYWGSNQLAGMALCERAAQLHGEDYLTDPWD